MAAPTNIMALLLLLILVPGEARQSLSVAGCARGTDDVLRVKLDCSQYGGLVFVTDIWSVYSRASSEKSCPVPDMAWMPENCRVSLDVTADVTHEWQLWETVRECQLQEKCKMELSGRYLGGCSGGLTANTLSVDYMCIPGPPERISCIHGVECGPDSNWQLPGPEHIPHTDCKRLPNSRLWGKGQRRTIDAVKMTSLAACLEKCETWSECYGVTYDPTYSTGGTSAGANCWMFGAQYQLTAHSGVVSYICREEEPDPCDSAACDPCPPGSKPHPASDGSCCPECVNECGSVPCRVCPSYMDTRPVRDGECCPGCEAPCAVGHICGKCPVDSAPLPRQPGECCPYCSGCRTQPNTRLWDHYSQALVRAPVYCYEKCVSMAGCAAALWDPKKLANPAYNCYFFREGYRVSQDEDFTAYTECYDAPAPAPDPGTCPAISRVAKSGACEPICRELIGTMMYGEQIKREKMKVWGDCVLDCINMDTCGGVLWDPSYLIGDGDQRYNCHYLHAGGDLTRVRQHGVTAFICPGSGDGGRVVTPTTPRSHITAITRPPILRPAISNWDWIADAGVSTSMDWDVSAVKGHVLLNLTPRTPEPEQCPSKETCRCELSKFEEDIDYKVVGSAARCAAECVLRSDCHAVSYHATQLACYMFGANYRRSEDAVDTEISSYICKGDGPQLRPLTSGACSKLRDCSCYPNTWFTVEQGYYGNGEPWLDKLTEPSAESCVTTCWGRYDCNAVTYRAEGNYCFVFGYSYYRDDTDPWNDGARSYVCRGAADAGRRPRNDPPYTPPPTTPTREAYLYPAPHDQSDVINPFVCRDLRSCTCHTNTIFTVEERYYRKGQPYMDIVQDTTEGSCVDICISVPDCYAVTYNDPKCMIYGLQYHNDSYHPQLHAARSYVCRRDDEIPPMITEPPTYPIREELYPYPESEPYNPDPGPYSGYGQRNPYSGHTGAGQMRPVENPYSDSRTYPGQPYGMRSQRSSGREPQSSSGQEPQSSSGREPQSSSGREPHSSSVRQPQSSSGRQPPSSPGQQPQRRHRRDVMGTVSYFVDDKVQYVVSPNYPHIYPQRVKSLCHLQTHPGATITLEVDHFELSEDTGCTGDFVIFRSGWWTRRVCGAIPSGASRESDTDWVQMYMETDDLGDAFVRGFMLAFWGVFPDGRMAEVSALCGPAPDVRTYIDRNDPLEMLYEHVDKPAAAGEEDGVPLTLVIGIAVGIVAVLLLVIIIVLCCYCHKRTSQPSPMRQTTPEANMDGKTTSSTRPTSHDNQYQGLYPPLEHPPKYEASPPQYSNNTSNNRFANLPPLPPPSAPTDAGLYDEIGEVAYDNPNRGSDSENPYMTPIEAGVTLGPMGFDNVTYHKSE